jgi:caa(3)-type oxidase subunit IV
MADPTDPTEPPDPRDPPEIVDERDEFAAHERPRSGAPYAYALVALLVLTGTSLGLHFVELGAAGAAAALTIAAIKVGIVGTIFMELRESMAATRTLAIVAAAFVVLLCLGVYGDVAFR